MHTPVGDRDGVIKTQTHDSRHHEMIVHFFPLPLFPSLAPPTHYIFASSASICRSKNARLSPVNSVWRRCSTSARTAGEKCYVSLWLFASVSDVTHLAFS